MSLLQLSANQLRQQLACGELTSVDLCTAYLDQIDQYDDVIGAFLRVDRDTVLQSAANIDARRKKGDQLGLLAGIPVAVKDLVCTKGEPTTSASKMLQNFVPPYDATVTEKLRAADAVLIGKTNMDEFAMGGSTENSALGTTRNPWSVDHVPGGSSGGAAACVAAKMAPLSIGSDTGGSIRQPASFCGVVGLKPTYGRVSRFGLIAFASSLDQIGPLAGSVEDTALLLEAIGGYDPRDSTSVDRPMPTFSRSVTESLSGLRLGLVSDHLGEGVEPDVADAVREACKVYESMGVEIVDVSLPHSKYGIATYYIIAASEASSNLSRYDGVHYGYRTNEREMLDELAAERQEAASSEDVESALARLYRRSRSEGFGPEVKRRIMLGTYALSAGYYDAYYVKALKVRRLIRQDYDEVFSRVDFLIGPVSPTPAFKTGERIDDPLSMYLADLFTVTANLAGVPGISVPCGFDADRMPIGLHLQGRPFDEERLLQVAYMFQSQTDWHSRRPIL